MKNFTRERLRLKRISRVFMLKSILCILLISMGSQALAQSLQLSGTVQDAAGQPLPGATVLEKGTSNGAVTDIDGNYSLKVKEEATIVVSFLGYKTQEIAVNGRSSITVTMQDDIASLEEIVVIGYGTTTVKDATGAVTSVGEKDFNKGNMVTPENLINGRVAGVNVSTGGAPGTGSTIRIRGGSSLDASNAPLVVINGLPIENTNVDGSRSPLSTINPNDIKSMTVLKDASATAIYGSRAANGVIIITTKEGGNELKVNVDLQGGISQFRNKVDVFSADEFRALVTERFPDRVEELGNANTDWQDEIYQDAYMYNANVAIQGSLYDRVPVRLSIGRSDQEGIRLTSRFQRNSASLNLTPSLFDDHLKINVNANGAIEENRFAGSQEGTALLFDPTQPVYQEGSPFGGFFQYYELDNNDELNADDLINLAPFNPVAELLQRNDISTVKRFYGNAKFDYQLHFFPDITATVNIGLDQQEGEGSVSVSNQNPLTQPDGSIIGSYSEYTGTRINSLLDMYLAYNKEFGALKLDATAGYSYQRFQRESFTTNETLIDTEATQPVTRKPTDIVLVGLFARTNLNWDNKYLLTLSYRRDGSSRFINDNRWGNFPAAAFAWQIKEDLLPDVQALSSLKLRVGWGITGQQELDGAEDQYLEIYQTGLPASQYRFGNETYRIGIPQFRNENLKWEETATYNVGIDYGFYNEKVGGSIEVFYKDTKDLFVNAAISDGSNFSNAGIQNLGDLTSKGIEFTLNSYVFESSEPNGFNWDVNYNATVIDREITRLAQDQDRLTGGIAGGTGGTIQIYRPGFDPFSFYVYNQIYDQEGNPVEGAFADLNGDNQINEEDRYIYKNGSPDITMGFLSNMSYMGFDFSFNLRASLGNYMYNNVNSSRAAYNQLNITPVLTNLPTAVRETGFQVSEDVILSDYFIQNASFLRMDNITLGYTFREILNSELSVRISGGVQNAFVVTKYSGLDPEINGGIDNTIYPRPRTYYLGANINF